MSASSELPEGMTRVFGLMLRVFAPFGLTEAGLLAGMKERMTLAAGQAPTQRDFFDAWTIYYRETMPPLSAMLAAAEVPFGFYDVIDFLAASCTDVAEGLARIGRYFTLVRPEVEFQLIEEAHHPTLVIVDHRREDDWFFDEWTVGMIVVRFREQLRSKFVVAACELRRPKPADAAAIESARALLGCDLRFGARSASISLPRDVWHAPLPAGNSRLRDTLDKHASDLLEEAASQQVTSRRVRELLAVELRGGDPSIERVARQLALTPRTLQRRLRDEGAAFQGLLEGLRAELARRYLGDERLGVSEVAFLLGYADASAFARAFRRWYGKAPAESRRERASS